MTRVGIALLAFTLPSCVLSDRHVNLEPVTGSSPASVGAGRSIIVIVDDQRASELRGLVGHTKNGYGGKMASVLADNEQPPAWVAECLAADLKRVGFDMREAGDPSAPMQLHVDLTICYAQAYWNYGAEVAAEVMLARGATVALPKQHFSGKATYGMNWGATDASYQAVLHAAMKNFLDAVTPTVAQATNAAP